MAYLRKVKFFTKTFIVSFFFLPLSLCAQLYNFTHYGVADGLGQSIVNAVYADSRGHIWFGTQDGGLSRFDGINMHTYTTEDGLPSNDILCITEDQGGDYGWAPMERAWYILMAGNLQRTPISF